MPFEEHLFARPAELKLEKGLWSPLTPCRKSGTSSGHQDGWANLGKSAEHGWDSLSSSSSLLSTSSCWPRISTARSRPRLLSCLSPLKLWGGRAGKSCITGQRKRERSATRGSLPPPRHAHPGQTRSTTLASSLEGAPHRRELQGGRPEINQQAEAPVPALASACGRPSQGQSVPPSRSQSGKGVSKKRPEQMERGRDSTQPDGHTLRCWEKPPEVAEPSREGASPPPAHLSCRSARLPWWHSARGPLSGGLPLGAVGGSWERSRGLPNSHRGSWVWKKGV